jgi:hypothetical protein
MKEWAVEAAWLVWGVLASSQPREFWARTTMAMLTWHQEVVGKISLARKATYWLVVV